MHPGAGTASGAILEKNWDRNQPTRPHLDQDVSLLMPLAPFSNSASVLTRAYDSVPKKYLRITELLHLLRCSVWPGWLNFHPVFHLALNMVDGDRSPHLIPRDFQSWNFCAKIPGSCSVILLWVRLLAEAPEWPPGFPCTGHWLVQQVLLPGAPSLVLWGRGEYLQPHSSLL